MPRTLPEWIGDTPDSKPPPRVWLRVWDAAGGKCQCCGRKIRSGEPWQVDHRQALINGGENRESNLQLLCDWCHKGKTRDDVAQKSRTYRKRKANLGMRRSRNPLPGSKASGWRHKMDGTWERRS